ncbi:MAG: S8 family serine peptidase, partial [Gammaproteobacteria bacterium]
ISKPHSPQAQSSMPDGWTEAMISEWVNRYADELHDDGNGPPEHPLWRYEKHYAAISQLRPIDGWQVQSVGDTFPRHGITPEVQALGNHGTGVPIAIIDTGVDATHSAFAGREVTGDGRNADKHGHGTFCASLAGSVWGVAPKSPIVALKGLSDDGWGSEGSLANYIRLAADQNVPIISCSFGGGGSQVMDSACAYAASQGSIVLAAAGNAGPGVPVGSPARSADFCVMAHNRNRQWTGFTQGQFDNLPNRIGANGEDIQGAAANTGGAFASGSGTSFSCPTVAGIAALLWNQMHDRTKVIRYLKSHSFTPPSGPGSIVAAADFGETPAPPTPPPTPAPPIEETWVHAIDLSYSEVSPFQAQALYARGYRFAVQCLVAAPPGKFEQPPHRVTNLRNLIAAGFHVAGYVALRPEASGSITVDRGYVGIPLDLWGKLHFVAIDVEIPGITLNHVLQGLSRLHGLGKHLEVVYTNYKSWHDDMGNPPGPSLSTLWNASWDNDPDVDFQRLPFGSWTVERLIGEQYQGSTVIDGVAVDRNVFRGSMLPPIPVAPPPPPPPPTPEPPPPVEEHGILTWRDGQVFRVVK